MSRRGGILLLFAGGGAAALLLAAGAHSRDVVVYNHSPSVPEGFYVRANQDLAPGVLVTVRARDVAPEEARRRNFAGPSDRFIKRVAAVGGERVCGDGTRVVVGDIVVTVLGADEQHDGAGGDDDRGHADDRGRRRGGGDGGGAADADDHADGDHHRLVGWRGCRVLDVDEVLLLGDTPDSFDGRYWGPINVRLIEGVWRKL